jgi:hypothetical protein
VATIKKWMSDRVGAYRDLPEYLRGLRKVGLEIVYGESVLALFFAIYTYVESISLCPVLAFFGGSFILAGYHIWRATCVPTVELQFEYKRPFLEPTPANAGNQQVYVRVLPKCRSALNATAYCTGLYREIADNNWDALIINDAVPLIWSNLGVIGAIPLSRNVPQMFDIFFVQRDQPGFFTSLMPRPLRVDNPLPPATYRFDLRVTESMGLSLIVSPGDSWDRPKIKVELLKDDD